MDKKQLEPVDGNTAATHIAYAFSDVAAIYPITPSSPMGEFADEWSSQGRKNVFGQAVDVIEMQSEGGAAGAIHGSLTAGALTTTFTASQGLMLMLPNMFKIAGELLPAVFHIAARSLACQSLSIFADHSDVMAVRGTGFAMLASASVQEVMDLATIAHLSAIEARVPFLQFFDGFRTSHEIQKIHLPDYESLKGLVDMKSIAEFRAGALNPEHPMCKVGAENPDVYFQGRETANRFYNAVPGIVKKYMALIKERFGRAYKLFDYVGHPQAEGIVIAMASACETIDETVNYLNKKGEKVGAIKVRLYRPFSVEDFTAAIPGTVKKIAVLDRTKEPGSGGEPLYLDVVDALKGKGITIIGGRYGLSSKEFTPAMVKAVFDHLNSKCTHNFTVGINDDVTHLSIPVGEDIDTTPEGTVQCKFWGLGSDGTVGANKNSIKIIGDATELNVQGYFEYDSKKSGGITVSHLRFGKSLIQSTYKLTSADLIALHNHSFIGKYDILKGIKQGGIFLINAPWPKGEVLKHLTRQMQETIINKRIRVYVIDAYRIAKEVGLGRRINTVMQVAFFKLINVMDTDKAITMIKEAIKKTYGKKGAEIVKENIAAVDNTLKALEEVPIPKSLDGVREHAEEHVLNSADPFIRNIVDKTMHLRGDEILVSQMTIDGAIPTGTTAVEKRGIANEVPKWIPENCIQCARCSFVCPHSAIRVKQINPSDLKNAPANFKTLKSNTINTKDLMFRVQVYPEDCVGCGNCVEECPVKKKALVMRPIEEVRKEGENENMAFFENLPDNVTEGAPETTIKGTQFRKQLFEFSGACAGCGETPYLRLVTQLFGDRMIIANATGCSSIYGGTFPVIPYCKTKEGRGPAWANSLFEDNAEYGFGMRLAIDANRKQLRANIEKLLKTGTTSDLATALKKSLKLWDRVDDEAKAAAKQVVELLPTAYSKVYGESKPLLEKIMELKDYLVDKSVWIIGGDGWAYDIGFGGLDHVLAQGKNVNVLVLDTEVYSNTGGQASKATPLAAIARFAAAGKRLPKKNLALMMTTYGYIYVASVNMGANKAQLIKAMLEAEHYNGPSIIIAYSPCIMHGINMTKSQEVEKKASASGYWLLFRYNPELAKQGKNPFIWDSQEPSIKFRDYIMEGTRYSSLPLIIDKKEAERLYKKAEEAAKENFERVKGIVERGNTK
ncbi:TPA: pyruvate:ferredoxin (flavodoxin) oxidoreductase [Candidatus Woesearchaeota archaeon]|nr:pyruvate:ferredoxin (flavodoxin) oxidoreductase [Candidatus Woesearchaeota archaeon]